MMLRRVPRRMRTNSPIYKKKRERTSSSPSITLFIIIIIIIVIIIVRESAPQASRKKPARVSRGEIDFNQRLI